MDVAYNQFASAARRKNRSTTNLKHLTLAPLTSKLPVDDDDALDALDPVWATSPSRVSYVEGKSAPTTPRLLSRSPGHHHWSASHVGAASTSTGQLSRSKSTTHLMTPHSRRRPRSTTSQHTRRRNPLAKEEAGALLSARDGSDTDWLLRAGAVMSTEAREYKGQAWLVSRASSTSLTGVARDTTVEDDWLERELARERDLLHSRHASRRGSLVMVDDDARSSPTHSRFGSRSHSHVGFVSRAQALAPADSGGRSLDGYFSAQHNQDVTPGPDFVNLDETLETEAAGEEDRMVADEAHVRRLVRRGHGGLGAWLSNALGLHWYAVDANEEGSDTDGQDDAADVADEAHEAGALERQSSGTTVRQFEGAPTQVEEDHVAPPKTDEGGWQDAAWLLSVASKVLV